MIESWNRHYRLRTDSGTELEKKVADKFLDMFPHASSGRNVSIKNYSGYSAGKAYGHAVGIGGGPRLTGRTS
jgi:hypothetical protein